MMHGCFENVPVGLVESARIDGCTRWQALARVTLPVVSNGIFATAVLTFIFAWNGDIFALALSRTEVMTFTVRVSGCFGAQPTIWARISAILPILLAVATVHRHQLRGISLGAIEG
jgi:multiple sugar transport system permease protein